MRALRDRKKLARGARAATALEHYSKMKLARTLARNVRLVSFRLARSNLFVRPACQAKKNQVLDSSAMLAPQDCIKICELKILVKYAVLACTKLKMINIFANLATRASTLMMPHSQPQLTMAKVIARIV
jgi:hypothetical protein